VERVITVRARGVGGGVAEGEALVCPDGIGAYGGLDPATGTITEYDNVHRGETVKDRILVMPGSKGSNGWSCIFNVARIAGTAPRGWLFSRIDSSAAVATVLLGIPTVVDFADDEDPCVLIRSGDWIRMDGESGLVEVCRPGGGERAGDGVR
jgi:predicted aconitase with swiveling domain